MCPVYEVYKIFDRTINNFQELTNAKFLAQMSNLKKSDYKNLCKYQGIYCFGGKKENEKVSNTLKVLDVSFRGFY